MTRIGFVLPPDYANHKPFRNQPLTQFLLASIIEKHLPGEAEVVFLDLRGVRKDCVRFYLPECDAYFYTVTSPEFPATAAVVEELRHIWPKARHVAGGPHVNLYPEESATVFDSIALGEGDALVLDVVRDVARSQVKPRYVCDRPVDIDAYPIPSRHYLPRQTVVDTGLLSGEHRDLLATTVIFSRGCPFRCSFCANFTFGPTRYRSPSLVTQEIETLKRDYGIKGLALKDDNAIPLNRAVAGPFLEAVGRSGLKWRGQARGCGIAEDMVRLAKESGCTDLGLGIESVSQEVLEIINKKINLKDARVFIDLLHKYGIGVRLHFILGLPGEPADIVERMIAFIEEVKPSSVLLCLLCPTPGSLFWNHPERFGMRRKNVDYTMIRSVFSRFDADEPPYLTFEYDPVTPFGKSLSNETILENYSTLQKYLRDNGLNF